MLPETRRSAKQNILGFEVGEDKALAVHVLQSFQHAAQDVADSALLVLKVFFQDVLRSNSNLQLMALKCLSAKRKLLRGPSVLWIDLNQHS